MYDFIGQLGRALTIAGFMAALASLIGYVVGLRNPSRLVLGRTGFHITVTSVIVASAALLILILKHQFQFHYVWAYSSRDLPFGFLASTFYAGQEGSFMLWTLMLAIIGVPLLAYARRKEIEPEVMVMFGIIMSFLLLLLVVKNPFARIDAEMIPADGKGLNPLLQNFWMQIHPPILFLGFAAMAPPFILAVAALFRMEYQDWVSSALPWTIAGSAALGLGIALGGFWAYETLGWGGWWGWDPVENSSLIPWIVSVAAVHTLLTQKKTGGLVVTNFLLVVSAFVLVLYSTFLTRSGVLGAASVHAFVDPGRFAFTLLVLFMFVFVDLGLVMIFARFTKWGVRLWERFSGWKLAGMLYLVVILPSVPLFARVGGDLVPVLNGAMQGGGVVLTIVFYPLLGLAHILNLLSYLWIPALVVKAGLLVYIATGRIHSEKRFESFGVLSRESFLSIGAAVLGLLALVVFVGTSLPIIPGRLIGMINSLLSSIGATHQLGNTVEPAFYDSMGLPMAIAITALMGSTLLLMWKSNNASGFLIKMLPGIGVAAAVSVVLSFFGKVHNAGMLLLAFFSVFAVVTNAVACVRIFRGNWRFAGAQISHIGVAVMMLGIIGSGFYGRTETLQLPLGEARSALGYNFTFSGFEPQQDNRDHFLVDVMDLNGTKLGTARTLMYISNYNNSGQLMRVPGILRFFSRDIYVEPQALDTPDPSGAVESELMKGASMQFEGHNIAFLGFAMNGAGEGQSFSVGGSFVVQSTDGNMDTLYALQETGPEGVVSMPDTTAAGDLEISYLEINVNQQDMAGSSIRFKVRNLLNPVAVASAGKESLVVQVSIKPFIGLVWSGIGLVMIGFVFAFIRRKREDAIRQAQSDEQS